MSAAARIALFVALLAVVFAGAAVAGGALNPSAGEAGDHAAAAPGATEGEHESGHGVGATATTGGGSAGAGAGGTPAGVASAQDGLRIVAGDTRFAARRAGTLRFRILDGAGATVRSYEPEQARLMHLIVVRRDLRRYQHLHPAQEPDGAWSVRLRLPDAGVYRAFADFRTKGARHTLGVDLFVAGPFDPLELPPASRLAEADGYDVTLDEHGAGELSFAVRRDGRVVADLQPYLGARGHLVALREGDLAYRHVHPEDGSPSEIAFRAADEEPGTYRLFLQFRHDDRVHTAAFTREVAP